MVDYARSKLSADRMIKKFGQVGLLKRAAGGATTGGWNRVPGSPASVPVSLVVLDYSNSEKDGTLIRQTDQRVLLAKGDLIADPTTADALVIGGVTKQIVNVSPLSPAGIVVFYDVQVR